MNSRNFAVVIACLLLFSSIVLSFVWLYPGKNGDSKEVAFDEALAKIRSKEISEVLIKQDSLELTTRNKEKFFAKLDAGDAPRAKILDEIKKVNDEKPQSIKTNLEQTSSGWGWIVVLNTLFPLLFFIMWGLTLAVIVYAVRTLSRNKG